MPVELQWKVMVFLHRESKKNSSETALIMCCLRLLRELLLELSSFLQLIKTILMSWRQQDLGISMMLLSLFEAFMLHLNQKQIMVFFPAAQRKEILHYSISQHTHNFTSNNCTWIWGDSKNILKTYWDTSGVYKSILFLLLKRVEKIIYFALQWRYRQNAS